jgi:hypothetical protein
MNIREAERPRPMHHGSARQFRPDGAGYRHHNVNPAVIESG